MFRIHTPNGEMPPLVEMPCTNTTVHAGEAMYISSGVLVAATGSNKPTHICMTEATVAASGDMVPCFLIEPEMVFETVFSANCSAAVGAKVTLSSDGMKVTGTTSSGVAEIVYKDGESSGDMVRVRIS